MAVHKENQLRHILDRIQKRWGTKGLQPYRQASSQFNLPIIPTGFPTLDQALTIRGIPRGRISEFVGKPTSGALTVALHVAVTAQLANESVVYVDLSQTFDPDYAVYCGVKLDQLFLVVPYQPQKATEMIYDMAVGSGIGVLIFDALLSWSGQHQDQAYLWAWLRRLTNRLLHTHCAMIVLTPPLGEDQGWIDTATLRLRFHNEGWLYEHQAVAGYTVQVAVLKNRFSPTRPRVSLAIDLEPIW
jgi:RecA/RadA recombinase